MADFSDAINTAAARAKRVSYDGTSVEFPSISELIEAEKHLTARNAAEKNHFGLRFVKLDPPGAGS